MKNFKTIAALLLLSFAGQAQEAANDTIERHNYNHWSVEFNVGQNKPVSPFAEGYYASKPNTFFYFNGVEHYDAGIRYMFSNAFGMKLDLGIDFIKNQDGSGSLDFEMQQYRIGLQGVANLGRVLRFETFTGRFGLLAHGGIQFATREPSIGINAGQKERDGGIIYGLTPQFRITNWLALTGDFTGMNNFRQHYNWDGSLADTKNSLSGMMFNTSLGLTVYIGSKEKKHADWYIPKGPIAQGDPESKKRLDAIESQLADTDRDGVPDYLDSENNTIAGVAVDTKGRAIDTNKNGIPDEMERKTPGRVDQQFEGSDKQGAAYNASHANANALTELVENGSINIFFDLNSATANSGSTNNVYMILQYLKDHPESRIQLTGYADHRGDEALNKELSQRRATNLKQLYVAQGIAASRIAIVGQGVDTTYPATQTGMDLARRVSVKMIR